MKDIIKSLLNKTSDDYFELIDFVLSIDLNAKEAEYIEFIQTSLDKLKTTPTETAMISKFPELEVMLNGNCKDLSYNDLEFHIREVRQARIAKLASLKVMDLASKIADKGLTDDDVEGLRDLIDTGSKEVSKLSYDFSYFKNKYIDDENKPSGFSTGVSIVDDYFGGLTPGTVNTILAYTSQFKSTWATNIAYNNTYNLGYNIAVISLEVPRDEMLYNILGVHSCCDKFNKYDFIPHDAIRKHKMTDEQKEYLLNDVLDDLNDNSKGQLFILDEENFSNFSYHEIRDTLYKVDDICRAKTGSGLDGLVIDHAHLLKFTDNANSKGKGEMAIINDYVSFFRRLTLKFRKLDDGTYSQLCTVLLAQSNRTGFDNACKKQGQYSLLAIAEANEIERASYRIMSIWTNDLLKEAKEALVCILKNRSGQTQYEPMSVYADGERYVFGDFLEQASAGATTIGDNFSSDNIFSALEDGDDFGFGF